MNASNHNDMDSNLWKYDQNKDIQRFLRESALSPSQSNPNLKLRVDFTGSSAAAKKKLGRPGKNARLPPSAAGAAGPSGSAASSSDQGSAAAASSEQDSARNTSGGGAPPAQSSCDSSMPPPETDRTDAAQDGAGATANAASPRGQGCVPYSAA